MRKSAKEPGQWRVSQEGTTWHSSSSPSSPLARARWVVLFSPARIAEDETVLEVEYPPLTEPRPSEV